MLTLLSHRKVNHIEMLHDVTEQTIVAQMECYVVPDWEQRYDELAAAREQECQVIADEPHGVMLGDMGKLQELAGFIDGISAEERAVLIEDMGGYEQPTRDRSPDFEL